jgi:hypothetical protein
MTPTDIKEIGDKTKISLSLTVISSIFIFLIGGAVGSLSMAKAYGAESAKIDHRITTLEKDNTHMRGELEGIRKSLENQNLALARIEERLARRP